MTKSPPSGSRFYRTRFRLLYLLVVTAGAIMTTLYLVAPHTERWSDFTCWAVFIAAWGSAISAWRRHRPHLRYWSGVYTFGVVVAGFVAMGMLLSGLWARQEVRPNSAPMPATSPASQYALESQRLYTAIGKNDLAGVESVLQTAESPAILNGSGEDLKLPPLDYAVEKGNLQIAAVLLDHGATVSDDQHNPLIAAARRNDLPMLRLLLHHGAPINDDNTWGGGSPALWSAVLHGNLKAVDCLLEAGANPRTAKPSPTDYAARRSVLQLARSQNNIPIAQRLKRAGATE